MSRTRKDKSQARESVLEILKRDDGMFDLIFNSKLKHSRVPERWLSEELCIRYGFCGQEFNAIIQEVNESGRARRVF